MQVTADNMFIIFIGIGALFIIVFFMVVYNFHTKNKQALKAQNEPVSNDNKEAFDVQKFVENQKASQKKFGFTVLFIFFIAGIFMFSNGINDYIRGEQSLSWPTTDGMVISSKVTHRRVNYKDAKNNIRSKTVYTTVVNYDYSVNERQYNSTDAKSGKNAVRSFPIGKELLVYYDPEDINSSTLQRGSSPVNFSFIVIGLFLILFTIGIYIAVKNQGND